VPALTRIFCDRGGHFQLQIFRNYTAALFLEAIVSLAGCFAAMLRDTTQAAAAIAHEIKNAVHGSRASVQPRSGVPKPEE
jgi:hypothetical protein